MGALRIEKIVDEALVEALPELARFRGQRVEMVVEEKPASRAARAKMRQLGTLKGQVRIVGDVDERLPDEIQRYFDGEENES